MIVLPSVNMAGLAVNSSGVVSFQNAGLTNQPGQKPASCIIYNESQVGLQCVFLQSAQDFFIPAGGWRKMTMLPNEAGYRWIVIYVITVPANMLPPNILVNEIYAPGEQAFHQGKVGNSPLMARGIL